MSAPNKIRFTQEQIQYLERLFPEQVGLGKHDEIVYQRGQRSVLQLIKEQNKVEVRLVPLQS